MSDEARQFRDWLKEQQGRDDGIGAFARSALADPMTGNFGTLIGYWVTWAAGEELAGDAHCAILEYDATLPKRKVKLPP